MPHVSHRKTGIIFFGVYFFLIIALFCWRMGHSGSTEYEQYSFGTTSDKTFELKENTSLDITFTVPQDAPHGIWIRGYSSNELTFTDEYLAVSVYSSEKKELETVKLMLCDQMDGMTLYVPFSKQYKAGEKIQVHFCTEGLKDKGIQVDLSKNKEYGSVLQRTGVVSEKYSLYGALCYEKVAYNYLKIFIFLFAEILIGLIGLFLYRRGMELFRSESSVAETGSKSGHVVTRGRLFKIVIEIFAFLFVSLVFWEYVYNYSIEEKVNSQDYYVDVFDETDLSFFSLKNQEELRTIYQARDNYFSGIGIWVNRNKDTEGTISLQVKDIKNGKILVDKTYKLNKLKKIDQILEDYVFEDNLEIADAVDTIDSQYSKKFYRLEFPQEIEDSKQQSYEITLEMTGLSDENGIEIALSTAAENDAFVQGKPVNGICLYSLYKNNAFLQKMFIAAVVLLTITSLAVLLMTEFNCCSFSMCFLVTGIIFGIIFSILIPPYCVPDERNHIDTVYSISNTLMGIEELPGPKQIYKRVCDVDGTKENTMSVDEDRYREVYDGLFKKAENTELVAASVDNALLNVSVFHYLPAAIGFSIARYMGFNCITMVMFGRWMEMLVSIFILYWAIRISPLAKSAFAVIAFLPISLQQIASCSYDGPIIAISALFVACCLKLASEKRGSVSEIIAICFSGAFLAESKAGVYILILGMILFIGRANSLSLWKRLVRSVALLVPIGVVFIAQFSSRLSALFTRSAGSAFRSIDNTASLFTVSYIFQYPIKALRIVENTVYLQLDKYLSQVLGNSLSYLDIYIPWFLLIGFLMLFVVADIKSGGNSESLNVVERFYLFIIIIAGFGLILFSMFISWTPITSMYIEGIQGRYFIPYLFVLIPAINGNVSGKKESGYGSDFRVLVLLLEIAIGCILLSVF